MAVRKRHKAAPAPGLLARLTAGMDPKLIGPVVLTVLASMGNCVKSNMDVAGARQAEEQAENRAEWNDKRLRAAGDSIRAAFSRLEHRLDADEAEIRRLRGHQSATVAPGSPSVVGPDSWLGPPDPPHKGTLMVSLGRFFHVHG